jgi:hypothetical protein
VTGKLRGKAGTETVGCIKWWICGHHRQDGKKSRPERTPRKGGNSITGYYYNMDLRRLIQPFGYGEEGKTAADNKTAEGRAKNRRVEIIILQNKGIANTVSSN